MGIFDGVLLCTDFDGTLAVNAEVSPENAAAIRYFEENGGRFTVVSGRSPYFSLEKQRGFKTNAPIVGFNGALVFDPDTQKMLFEGGRGDFAMLDFMWPYFEADADIEIIYVHCKNRAGEIKTFAVNRGDGTTLAALKERLALPIYNAIFVVAATRSAAMRRELEIAADGLFVPARSWDKGLELINPEDTKGAAVKRLKEMLGCRLAVAAGDYENDISMLQAADIGYAVANATPEVKAAADRVTVHCREHAIAAIVKDLENMCKKA